MEDENESMKLSKSALEKKGKTASAYDGGLDGPWRPLDLWRITWGNGLTCFSSLWLSMYVQEFITSLERLEHEKGIILFHDIFTCSHCIKKKGGTFIGFWGHYVSKDSSLFGLRNHAISKVTLLLQKATIYGDNLCINWSFHTSSLCLVWTDLEGEYSDMISTFFDLSWCISREAFDRGRWKTVGIEMLPLLSTFWATFLVVRIVL